MKYTDFISLSSKYLLSSYYVPYTPLGPEVIINEADENFPTLINRKSPQVRKHTDSCPLHPAFLKKLLVSSVQLPRFENPCCPGQVHLSANRSSMIGRNHWMNFCRWWKWNLGSLKGIGHQKVSLYITLESGIRLNVMDTHKLYLLQKNLNLMD